MNGKTSIGICALIVALVGPGCSGSVALETRGNANTNQASLQPVIGHSVTDIRGAEVALSRYRGKVLLIVNTASQCGFTDQYDGLQALWTKHRGDGLVVLGFPCNDYGGQEPGGEAEIADFCRRNHGVDFPLFAKVHAKGPDKHPLFKTLTEETSGALRGEIGWNFTKFLVGRDGRVMGRFSSSVSPDDERLTKAIADELAAGAGR